MNVLPQLRAGRNVHEMVDVPTETSEAPVGSEEETYYWGDKDKLLP